MCHKSETISFRASEDLLRQIDKAREPFGISRGDWVRGVVTGWLFREGEEGRTDQLSEIANGVHRGEDELAKLNARLARAVYLILTCATDIEPAEIQALVRDKLLT